LVSLSAFREIRTAKVLQVFNTSLIFTVSIEWSQSQLHLISVSYRATGSGEKERAKMYGSQKEITCVTDVCLMAWYTSVRRRLHMTILCVWKTDCFAVGTGGQRTQEACQDMTTKI
jgi:hypothetical protein